MQFSYIKGGAKSDGYMMMNMVNLNLNKWGGNKV